MNEIKIPGISLSCAKIEKAIPKAKPTTFNTRNSYKTNQTSGYGGYKSSSGNYNRKYNGNHNSEYNCKHEITEIKLGDYTAWFASQDKTTDKSKIETFDFALSTSYSIDDLYKNGFRGVTFQAGIPFSKMFVEGSIDKTIETLIKLIKEGKKLLFIGSTCHSRIALIFAHLLKEFEPNIDPKEIIKILKDRVCEQVLIRCKEHREHVLKLYGVEEKDLVVEEEEEEEEEEKNLPEKSIYAVCSACNSLVKNSEISIVSGRYVCDKCMIRGNFNDNSIEYLQCAFCQSWVEKLINITYINPDSGKLEEVKICDSCFVSCQEAFDHDLTEENKPDTLVVCDLCGSFELASKIDTHYDENVGSWDICRECSGLVDLKQEKKEEEE